MKNRFFLLIFFLFSALIYGENPSLGGYIWYDKDVDGVQDYGEKGIYGVRVHLLKDGVETGDINYTDEKGVYLFEELEPNHNYSIKVILPRNYIDFTIPNVGQKGDEDIGTDSDIIKFTQVVINDRNYTAGISEEIYLKEDEHYRDLDAGLVCECVAWIDIEKSTNGVDADSPDEAVQLRAGDEVIWEYNVSNSSRVKIQNIKVIDDKEGEIDCPKDSLEPGEYMICIKKGVAKEGLYENKVVVTGEDENGTKVSDEDISHYIAKYPLGCIGDFYWYDESLNGVQDKGEPGVIGIKVELYDENKTLLRTTQTDNEGKYLFCDLEAGNYYVKFYLPPTYLFVPPDRGRDSEDSDARSDGWSHLINLGPGEKDLTIDAGIYCSCDEYVFEENKRDISAINFINIIIVAFIIAFIALTLGERHHKNR